MFVSQIGDIDRTSIIQIGWQETILLVKMLHFLE